MTKKEAIKLLKNKLSGEWWDMYEIPSKYGCIYEVENEEKFKNDVERTDYFETHYISFEEEWPDNEGAKFHVNYFVGLTKLGVNEDIKKAIEILQIKPSIL